MRTAKTLIRLGGCPGWSESSPGAQSFCSFCHEVSQIQRHSQDFKDILQFSMTSIPHSRMHWNHGTRCCYKSALVYSGLVLSCRLGSPCPRDIHVIRHDFVGTYRYWAPKYESRPTDRNSRYIWIPIFRCCQKLKLVFRSPQTLALSKFTTGSGNRTLLVFRNR